MVYSEIQDLCAVRKMTVNELASLIGMTYQGLKASLNNQKMGMDKVDALCKVLRITPNEFFGWKDVVPTTYNATQVGMLNNQNIGGIELLQKQLEVKDEQIKQLLNLLNK